MDRFVRLEKKTIDLDSATFIAAFIYEEIKYTDN